MVPVGNSLQLLTLHELLILLLVLSVHQPELLLPRPGEEGDHDWLGLLTVEGEVGVGPRGILLDLLP